MAEGVMGQSGCGVGLSYRRSLGSEILKHRDCIDLVELVADNVSEPLQTDITHLIARQVPVACHSLGLSVGSDEPVNEHYLERIAGIVELTGARWLGDHLAMTRIGETELEHLLPIAFSWQMVETVAKNVERVKRQIAVPIILENISYYVKVPGAELSEWRFITEVCKAAGCGLLLDLNNLHVNATNHSYDPFEFLDGIPPACITQIHLAGCALRNGVLLDTHADPVVPEVWTYLEWILSRCKPEGIILEWDRDYPSFDVILEELAKARSVLVKSRS